MASSDQVRITVGGRLALTINQAAAVHGLKPDAMRKALDRAGVEPIRDASGQPVRIERVPLYSATAVKAAMTNRPGRGAPGVSRPHRPPAPDQGR